MCRAVPQLTWPRDIVEPYMAKVAQGGRTRLYQAIKETVDGLRATTAADTVKVLIAFTDGDDTYQGITGLGSSSTTEEEGESIFPC